MTHQLVQHASASALPTQFKQANEAYLAACMRTIEIMLMEMKAMFDLDESIESVCFDQDGDPDNVPLFILENREGKELDEGLEAVDEVEQRWNATRNAAAVDFMVNMEGMTLRRSELAADLNKACEKLAKTLPCETNEARAWKESFLAHLLGERLEVALPSAKRSERPGPRL